MKEEAGWCVKPNNYDVFPSLSLFWVEWLTASLACAVPRGWAKCTHSHTHTPHCTLTLPVQTNLTALRAMVNVHLLKPIIGRCFVCLVISVLIFCLVRFLIYNIITYVFSVFICHLILQYQAKEAFSCIFLDIFTVFNKLFNSHVWNCCIDTFIKKRIWLTDEQKLVFTLTRINYINTSDNKPNNMSSIKLTFTGGLSNYKVPLLYCRPFDCPLHLFSFGRMHNDVAVCTDATKVMCMPKHDWQRFIISDLRALILLLFVSVSKYSKWWKICFCNPEVLSPCCIFSFLQRKRPVRWTQLRTGASFWTYVIR